MKRLIAAGALLLLLLTAGGCRNTINDCPWFYEPDDALAGDIHDDYAQTDRQPQDSRLSEVR